MSLFDTILSSISNPNHGANQGDLQNLVGLAQSLPQLGAAAEHVGPILSAIQPHLQDALSQQHQDQGAQATQQTVSDLSQGNPGLQQIQNLLGPDRMSAIFSEIEQRTGLNQQVIEGLLPVVIPAVMRLLAGGGHQTDASAPNPVLGSFLGQGGGNLGDLVGLASKFLGGGK
jgi:hypothetical protein